MEHILKFNEKFFWKKKSKELSKKNMFIEHPKHFPDTFDPKDDKNKDKLFFGKKNLSPTDDSVIKNPENGCFYIQYYSSGDRRGIDFGTPNNYSYWDEKWFDYSEIFKKLREINRKIGYNVGQEVTVKLKNVDTVIENIINFCYYTISFDRFDAKFTLLYLIDKNYYNINQIELVKNSESNIVDNVIQDNFLELMDEGIVDYRSSIRRFEGRNTYDCEIFFKMDPENLFKVSEQLMVASRRLKDENIQMNILDISKSSIKFWCH